LYILCVCEERTVVTLHMIEMEQKEWCDNLVMKWNRSCDTVVIA
jgi:hypothetical protein